MKRESLMIAVLFISFRWLLPAVADAPRNPELAKGHVKLAKRETVESFLYKTSIILDFYYTVEVEQSRTDPEKNMSYDGLKDTFLSSEKHGEDEISDVIRTINDSLGYEAAFLDKSNPAVIHIMGKALHSQKTNALNLERTISYIGKLSNLPDYIGKRLGPDITLRSPIGGGIGEQVMDDSTSVTFKDVSGTVREILSNYIPLSKYRRCLWRASTLISKDNTTIIVKYSGPASGTVLPFQSNDGDDFVHGNNAGAEPLLLTFDEGELAYRYNEATNESTATALTYIANYLDRHNGQQVRWAMLWLGEHGIEKSIPVLLNSLDYVYTSSPLLDERFPAYAALKKMGQLAIPAILNELSREENPVKLELLCRLVIETLGEPVGRTSIEKAIINVANIDRQRAMKNALRDAGKPVPHAIINCAT